MTVEDESEGMWKEILVKLFFCHSPGGNLVSILNHLSDKPDRTVSTQFNIDPCSL